MHPATYAMQMNLVRYSSLAYLKKMFPTATSMINALGDAEDEIVYWKDKYLTASEQNMAKRILKNGIVRC